MPVTSRPSRTLVGDAAASAASVVLPSKHSPGPSPYMGWKWSKPQTPSKPSSSAKRARDASSAHGIRCWAMSSPNFMPGLLSRARLADGAMRLRRSFGVNVVTTVSTTAPRWRCAGCRTAARARRSTGPGPCAARAPRRRRRARARRWISPASTTYATSPSSPCEKSTAPAASSMRSRFPCDGRRRGVSSTT